MIDRPNPNSFRLPCGCMAIDTGLTASISYCSTHGAAPDLLEALENCTDWMKNHGCVPPCLDRGQAAIALAKPR